MGGIPSPSGARISGDAYQHTFTWLHALRLLQQGLGVVSVGFEVAGVRNVDDLVVQYDNRPTKYHQLKFVMTQGEMLTCDWFMTPDGKQSPLQRFWHSFNSLNDAGSPPAMALQTNRLWDGNDPLPAHLSGRQNKLAPRLREPGPRTAAGKARAAWAKHLEIDEDELFGMLEHLEINAGRGSLESLREECLGAQHAAGLRPDENVLDIGVAEVARMIGDGVREVDAAALREFVSSRELSADHRRGVVLVQALDHDPWPEAANASLDWVDLFAGADAGTRRQLLDPSGWNSALKPDLQGAVVEMRRQGYEDVLVTGLMRLPAAFAVGYHFSDVAGFAVATRQRHQDWDSVGDGAAVELIRQDFDIGQGDEIAIAVSVSNDLSGDVLAHVRREVLPVVRLVHLQPAAGVGPQAVADAAAARGLARQVLLTVREAVREQSATRVHLLLTAPRGLALLLGNVWNAVPETVVYEHLLADRYYPTFTVG